MNIIIIVIIAWPVHALRHSIVTSMGLSISDIIHGSSTNSGRGYDN